ncbi:iron uptake transporter permease EfeU [Basilea psittacipulmonis]|uniref:Iron transporter n=1 Tax=Basilea psittacipulmonis DSM 24701 TaxID=1072685 RepID=A0A077DGT0_9BURK|nr:iron uptake transporter permease EfeU [Basilea psittacipulmonis]AIL32368.1 iron transporter [Basilea psittacipulmonis DSM 24701]
MLVIFFILLREGMEAALIVGIVATFLKQSHLERYLPKMWLGVISAGVLCAVAGFLIHYIIGEFPQKQQGIISGCIALFAVAMLTYMILWMKKAARHMKKNLENSVNAAIHGHDETHASWALCGMAFLAVVREGTETVFFILAAAQNIRSWEVISGGVLGLMVAAIVGWLIYEGGVRINLAKFFRWTGVFLIIVAAGLLAVAFRNFHNAGWWNIGQTQIADWSGFMRESSTIGTIMHGFFGYTEHPTFSDFFFWIAYLIPVLYLFLRNTSTSKTA